MFDIHRQMERRYLVIQSIAERHNDIIIKAESGSTLPRMFKFLMQSDKMRNTFRGCRSYPDIVRRCHLSYIINVDNMTMNALQIICDPHTRHP